MLLGEVGRRRGDINAVWQIAKQSRASFSDFSSRDYNPKNNLESIHEYGCQLGSPGCGGRIPKFLDARTSFGSPGSVLCFNGIHRCSEPLQLTSRTALKEDFSQRAMSAPRSREDISPACDRRSLQRHLHQSWGRQRHSVTDLRSSRYHPNCAQLSAGTKRCIGNRRCKGDDRASLSSDVEMLLMSSLEL
jgi:hypothetical protein